MLYCRVRLKRKCQKVLVIRSKNIYTGRVESAKTKDPLPLWPEQQIQQFHTAFSTTLHIRMPLCQIEMLGYPLILIRYVTVVTTFLLPLSLQAANLPAYPIPVSSINSIQILPAANDNGYQPCMRSSFRIAGAIETHLAML